jgi:hypothetical protein
MGLLIIIVIILIVFLGSQYEESKKKKEQTIQKWDTITTGMSKDEVIRELGKPNRVLQVDTQEAWGYGPSDSDGVIMFVDDKIIAYRKPI